MKRHVLIANLVLITLMSMQPMALAESIEDYLILKDIGLYKLAKPEKMFPGEPPMGGARTYESIGESGVDHFPDHIDKNYEGMYLGGETKAVPTVQVTKHPGSDSDKWLLHEIDMAFRDYYGIPSKSYISRLVAGQTIMVDSVGGRNYRWLSGNKVIMIEYHGSLRTMPEPIEVVQAYLAKHPSTLPAMTLQELRSTASKTSWIKDEMDRRLWLCDKWYMQLQLRKVEERQVYQESVKSMNVFLDYREKYFGIKAADEKNLIAGYLSSNNGTGIKAKLTEYKNWWSMNKEKGISL